MKSKLMRGGVAAVGFVAALASWPFAPIPYAQEVSEVARLPPLSYPTSRRLANDPQALRDLLARVPKVSTAPVAPLPRAENPPAGGTWSGLTNPAPASGMSNPILVTDGSVLVHQECRINW